MKTKNCEAYFKLIDQLKEYFEKHLEEFARMIEFVDDIDDDLLNDDRLIPMYYLNEELHGRTPTDIIERAFYGFDFAPYALMARSSFTPGAFNPNAEFFYWNGYGNLVSVRQCLVPEYYSKFIDRYHVEQIFNSWFDGDICTFAQNDELIKIFTALSEFED